MSADWSILDAALERAPPTLWWRDDDAVAASPALDRLLALAGSVSAPITLAAIPATTTESLARAVRDQPVTIATHGWSHTNHAPPDRKKAEFGPYRPVAEMVEDAARGKTKLDALFGAQSLPLFVPPWNRMSAELFQPLETLGFKAVSTFAEREMTWRDGLVRMDSHIDPIDWRGTRSAVTEQNLIDHMLTLVRSEAPIGLMTHHLVHDDAIWSLTETLISHLSRYGAQWISALDLMTRAPD